MCTATTCAISISADSRTHPSAPRYGLRGVGCLKQMPNAVFQQFDSPLQSAELSNPDYSVAELMLSWKKESHMRIGSVSNSLLMLMAGGAASLSTAAPACAAPCAKIFARKSRYITRREEKMTKTIVLFCVSRLPHVRLMSATQDTEVPPGLQTIAFHNPSSFKEQKCL